MREVTIRAAGFPDAFAVALVSNVSTPTFAFLEADWGTGDALLILVLASSLAVRTAAIPFFAHSARFSLFNFFEFPGFHLFTNLEGR